MTPILNPAIITLMLAFFGIKATVIYASFTFVFAVVMGLILGGAGASIPEVLLLSSIFKKKMVVTFVLCIFAVAVITGYVFNFIL